MPKSASAVGSSCASTIAIVCPAPPVAGIPYAARRSGGPKPFGVEVARIFPAESVTVSDMHAATPGRAVIGQFGVVHWRATVPSPAPAGVLVATTSLLDGAPDEQAAMATAGANEESGHDG